MQCRNDVPEAPTPTLPVLSTHHSQSISGVDTAPGYEDKNESFESILSPVRADYPTGLERGCSKPGGLGQSQSWDSYLVLTELCSSSWSWQNLTAPKEKKKSQIARSPTSVSLFLHKGELDTRLQFPLLHSAPDNLQASTLRRP